MRAAAILTLLLGCTNPTPSPIPTPTPTPAPNPSPSTSPSTNPSTSTNPSPSTSPSTNPSTSTSTMTSTPVLTSAAELDRHVGQLVTLRGTLTRTKIPTILGVDVAAPAPDDLADRPAEATGTLEREVVTQEQLDRQIAERGQFASRGAGTFYRLVRPGGGGLAPPRAPP